jgi:hypothetical protein
MPLAVTVADPAKDTLTRRTLAIVADTLAAGDAVALNR